MKPCRFIGSPFPRRVARETSLLLGWQCDVEADSAPSLLGLIAAVPGCLSWVVAVTMVSQKSYVVKPLADKVPLSNTRKSIFGVGSLASTHSKSRLRSQGHCENCE